MQVADSLFVQSIQSRMRGTLDYGEIVLNAGFLRE